MANKDYKEIQSSQETAAVNTKLTCGTGNKQSIVGFKVLTAVVMKSTIFWDTMPCSPLKVN
jgi:hypothetical protein